jgi:secondary thiamine-phosphate synthase enzyme
MLVKPWGGAEYGVRPAEYGVRSTEYEVQRPPRTAHYAPRLESSSPAAGRLSILSAHPKAASPPMHSLIDHLELATTAPIQIIDITSQVRDCVRAAGLRHGLVTLISRHTTARVNLNEREERLQQDMLTFLKRLVPRDGDYGHNIAPVDDRDNAHAHLLGLFINASESIPVADGELLLGEWQSVFFVELDGPRPQRQVTIQLLGSLEP